MQTLLLRDLRKVVQTLRVLLPPLVSLLVKLFFLSFWPSAFAISERKVVEGAVCSGSELDRGTVSLRNVP